MADLLPCPFCGEMPYSAHTEEKGYSGIGCNDCEILLDDEETPGDVAPRWNRRQPYLPPEDVETLRKVVAKMSVIEYQNPPISFWCADLRAIIEKVTK